MKLLGYTEQVLQELKAIDTAREIVQQPNMWKETFELVKQCKKELQVFLDEVMKDEEYEIVFTGAGSSEFVGNSIYTDLNKKYVGKVHSFASTDMVPDPIAWINPNKRTLLVSFGRSGNSPESLGAIYAAESVSNQIYHLAITCNANGKLSKLVEGKEHGFVLNLPKETHDLGFAMTSSFSSMLLCAYLCLNLDRLDDLFEELMVTCDLTSELVESRFEEIQDIIESYDFKRIVYLGTGTYKGIAQESALKMLELTAGLIPTMHDTPLGFRHGPKSIVDDETLTVVLLSQDDLVYRYEKDLCLEMNAQKKNNLNYVLSSKLRPELINEVIQGNYEDLSLTNPIMIELYYLVFGHLLAFYKSIKLGITPDNPCITGEVNRVVKGVILYPY